MEIGDLLKKIKTYILYISYYFTYLSSFIVPMYPMQENAASAATQGPSVSPAEAGISNININCIALLLDYFMYGVVMWSMYFVNCMQVLSDQCMALWDSTLYEGWVPMQGTSHGTIQHNASPGPMLPVMLTA